MEDLLFKVLQVPLDKGATFADANIFINRSTSVSKTNIDKTVEQNSLSGVSLRVFSNGSIGYGFTNSFEKKDLLNAISNALKAANSQKGNISFPERPTLKKTFTTPIKTDPDSVSVEEKVGFVNELFSAAKNKKILSIRAGYSDGTTKHVYADSSGSYMEQSLKRARLLLFTVAKKGKKMVDFYDSLGGAVGYEVTKNAIGEFSDNIVKKTIEQLSSGSSPKGNYPVVLDGTFAGVLAHESIGHPSEADFVINGRSFLAGRLGEKIASPFVSITDTPTIPSSGFYFFDHDGTLAKRTSLVKDGVLSSHLHSVETALRFGTESTGNGRMQGFGKKVFVRMSNIFFEPGEMKTEELFEGIKKGVYIIKNICGMEDPAGGGFYVSGAMGYWIENGELTRPIRGEIVLSGSQVLEILKLVSGVSNDFATSPGACGKGHEDWVPSGTGGPHMRIDNILVGGD